MQPARGGFDRGDARSKKKKARRILRPDEKQKSKETIPVGLPALERFYAGILRSEATDFLGDSKGLWETICSRLALPTPKGPLPSSYGTQQAHFSNRAALVIEEARQALSDSIRELKNGRNSNYQRSSVFPNKNGRARQSGKDNALFSMDLSITRVEHKGSGHSILTFAKKSQLFTKEELQHFRQGTIFSCLDRKTTHTIENIFLGVVLPQSREEMITSNSVAVMLFRKIKKTKEGIWKLTPILSLLSEQRKFEACLIQMATPVPFLLPLLGRNRSGHALQTHGGEAKILESQNADDSGDCEVLEFVDLACTFQIPRLNKMQEKAATAFLTSKSDTINLVQGPPGTGKTTLLTSVVCRYIIDSRKLEHKKRCLMVCAPTNKAVTVLCSRFLKTFDNESYPCNVVVIGDEDKLLENEIWSRGNSSTENSKLRENFLYTFIDAVKDEYLYVRSVLDKGDFGRFGMIQSISCRLKNLLIQKVADKEVFATAERIERMIRNFSKSGARSYPREIITKIDLILGMISAWDRDSIWQDILRSADVIFCTLGSSGSLFLKKVVGEIDDLIVDEAAAATEPEIYIPFQYLPRRLLCVGDPKQLPATITSRFAEKMGLSKSLHERLMYNCNHYHVMLDTQYRMNPALSQFPSNNFYEGKLINGKNVLGRKKLGGASMMSHSVYTLYQINGKERQNRSGSIENQAEANAVVRIVENFRQASRGFSSGWCAPNRLRIITFYQAQVSLIKRLLYRRKLGNVLVSTVDSSQGCEADFVIISFVRSDGEAGRNTVGFVADDRRLNVALTRAKYQLICVGNIERMTNLPDGKAGSVKRLARDALNRHCVQSFPSKIPSSSRTTDGDNHESTMERKRKPELLERKYQQDGSRDKAARRSFGAKTSDSSSESDESSVVSSSSSESDSSASTSSEPESSAAISTSIQSDAILFRPTPPVECPAPKSEAGATFIMDTNPPSRNGNKALVESDLPLALSTKQTTSIQVEQPDKGGRKRITTPGSIEVTAFDEKSGSGDERENMSQHIPIAFKEKQSSMLSKSETMAVFEDFLF